ncbi:MAG: hypothetical protein ABSE92_05630 [Terriglobales bacterium]
MQLAMVFLALLWLVTNVVADSVAQPVVQVEVPQSFGPRPLEDQTKDAVVRDYLKCWNRMSQALEENNAAALDTAFTGIAKEKLEGVVSQQQKANITASYRDRSHHITFVFYSSEGLSIQVVDDAEYDVELSDHGKMQATHHVKARYVAVLTPTEVSWKVRMFQADANVGDSATAKK